MVRELVGESSTLAPGHYATIAVKISAEVYFPKFTAGVICDGANILELLVMNKFLAECPTFRRIAGILAAHRNAVANKEEGAADPPLTLADGAIVNAGNPNDLYCWTALHKGAYRGAVAAVKLLLEAGADVEARDTWNKTGGTHASASICLLEAAAAPLLSCAAQQQLTCRLHSTQP